MRRAVIVSAARTAIRRRNGSLSGWRPAELAAHVLSALTSRVGVDPQLVDDVTLGCVTQVGTQMRAMLDELIAAGIEGRRTGRGFYRYKDGRGSGPNLDVATTLGLPISPLPLIEVGERL